MKSVFEHLNLSFNVFGIHEDTKRHKENLNQEQELHDEEVRISKEQHIKELFIEKQIYLLSTYADIEAYCQELNENLIQSNRDAERDMMDQRNQQLQTVLISGTIMLSAIVGVLFQAALPDESDDYIVGFYSITVALSISLLVISMFISIKNLYKIYQFMFSRSTSNIRHLQKTLAKTSVMDSKILSGVVENDAKAGRRITTKKHQERVQTSSSLSVKANKSFVKRKFADLPPDQVNKEFASHEIEVENYFRVRDALNQKLYHLAGGERKRSFEKYWNDECDQLNKWSIQSFYGGTFVNVVATFVFLYSYFKWQYQVQSCGIVIVIIMGSSLLVTVFLFRRMRSDKLIQNLRLELKANNAQDEAGRRRILKGDGDDEERAEDDIDEDEDEEAFRGKIPDRDEKSEDDVDDSFPDVHDDDDSEDVEDIFIGIEEGRTGHTELKID
jgi:hypothetical protein